MNNINKQIILKIKMKKKFIPFILLTTIYISLISCQINLDQAINSCGKLGYTRPASKEDCKPGGSNFKCCLIDIPEKGLKYCAFVPGKVTDNVIQEFKDVLSVSSVSIECNKSWYIHTSSFLLFILIFIFL